MKTEEEILNIINGYEFIHIKITHLLYSRYNKTFYCYTDDDIPYTIKDNDVYFMNYDGSEKCVGHISEDDNIYDC